MEFHTDGQFEICIYLELRNAFFLSLRGVFDEVIPKGDHPLDDNLTLGIQLKP